MNIMLPIVEPKKWLYDGNVEAVMAVYKYKDGKIASLETGATPMPK